MSKPSRGVVKTRLQEHTDRVLAEVRGEWAYQDEYAWILKGGDRPVKKCQLCGRRMAREDGDVHYNCACQEQAAADSAPGQTIETPLVVIYPDVGL